MKSRLSRLALAVSTCATPFAVTAQATAPVPELSTVIVTASRSAQLENEVLGDVTVIDQEELKRAGQSSLAEVLSRHHGIEFYNQGGPQTTTGIFLRGANAAHTLVLLDGIPVNGATSGLSALNAVPAASIDHIEVLRGSASSLYGANAVGGVINVITKGQSEEPFSAYASAGVGTYATSKYSAGIAGRVEAWNYSLGTAYEQSGGFNATNSSVPFGHNPDKESYYLGNLRGTLGYEWHKGQKISLQTYTTRISGGIDFDQFNPYNDRSIQTLEMTSLSSENQLTEYWKSTLRYAHTVDKNRTRSATSDTLFSTRQDQYSWQNELTLGKDQKLILAYEHLGQDVSGDIPTFNPDFSLGPNINFDQTKRHNNAYTGVYSGNFDRHHVQASLRNDNDSQFGKATTWGLSYGYDLTDTVRAHMAASTGFRTPTFNDLYYPGFANPDLQPERSRNIEAGLKYTGDATRLGLTLFQNKIRDLIVFDPMVARPDNLDRATIRGVTATAEHDYGNTTVRASADFLDPRNDVNDNQLNRRARRIFRLGADHRLDQWTFGTEVALVGERYDDPDNQIRLGGYGLWNLTAAYDFNKNLGVQVRWNNVLNKDYTNAYGYNMPGSNVFVNLAWRM